MNPKKKAPRKKAPAKKTKPKKAKKPKKPVGRPRVFNNEAEMLKAWNGFKENLKEQAKEWLKVQYVGKDGDRVTDAQKVPLTLEGFKRYCREYHGEVEQYFGNQDKLYNDFIGICSRIREEIRENQIIGGLLGFYNPSITQRLNGLKEQAEVDNKVTLNVPNIPDIGNRK